MARFAYHLKSSTCYSFYTYMYQNNKSIWAASALIIKLYYVDKLKKKKYSKSKYFLTPIKWIRNTKGWKWHTLNYENKYTLCVRTKSRTTNDVKARGKSNIVNSHSWTTLLLHLNYHDELTNTWSIACLPSTLTSSK